MSFVYRFEKNILVYINNWELYDTFKIFKGIKPGILKPARQFKSLYDTDSLLLIALH